MRTFETTISETIMSEGKKRLEKRRKFIQKYVNEKHKAGEKIQASIYDLSEKLFLSTRQIENDLYYKGDKAKKPKPNKHKF